MTGFALEVGAGASSVALVAGTVTVVARRGAASATLGGPAGPELGILLPARGVGLAGPAVAVLELPPVVPKPTVRGPTSGLLAGVSAGLELAASTRTADTYYPARKEAEVAADITVKVGDTGPLFAATLKDGEGNAIDLTGSTVKLEIRLPSGKIVTRSVTVDQTPSTGKVTYAFVAEDTAERGEARARFTVDEGQGVKYSVPSSGWIGIVCEGPFDPA